MHVYKPRRKQYSRVTRTGGLAGAGNAVAGKGNERRRRGRTLPGDMHRRRRACDTENVNKANISDDGPPRGWIASHGGALARAFRKP